MTPFVRTLQNKKKEKKKKKIYIYIYIYGYGGDPTWWVHVIQHFHFFPNFIVKMAKRNPHKFVGFFHVSQFFSSFLFLPFLP